MILDPIDALENSDDSEIEVCRHCRDLIAPGAALEWNGWFWHHGCVPSHVLHGLEEAARHDDRKHA